MNELSGESLLHAPGSRPASPSFPHYPAISLTTVTPYDQPLHLQQCSDNDVQAAELNEPPVSNSSAAVAPYDAAIDLDHSLDAIDINTNATTPPLPAQQSSQPVVRNDNNSAIDWHRSAATFENCTHRICVEGATVNIIDTDVYLIGGPNRQSDKLSHATHATYPLSVYRISVEQLRKAQHTNNGAVNWQLIASASADIPSYRHGHTTTQISAHELLVYGGCYNYVTYSDMFIFNTLTSEWQRITQHRVPFKCSARAYHTTCFYQRSASQHHNNSFAPQHPHRHSNDYDRSVEDDDAQSALPAVLLVYGGSQWQRGSYTHYADLYIFNLQSHTWSAAPVTGEVPAGRSHHTASIIGTLAYTA